MFIHSATVLLLLASLPAFAQIPSDPPESMRSLKTVPVPGPSPEDVINIFRNKRAVIRLGKALFWEMKVGSDNLTACASCHFHAGADNRTKNQISPGLAAGDISFQFARPNYRLLATDFPIPFQRHNNVNDVITSQGVFNASFVSVNKQGVDVCKDEADFIFHGLSSNGEKLNTRQVEPRNTPSIINAVFNFRNFWDGRANNIFNGIDPFGKRNDGAFVWKVVGGELKKVKLDLPFSSLASQASGPPLSGLEMSCRQRTFVDLGKKLLKQKILGPQKISPNDSILGDLHRNRPTYAKMIKDAFKQEWWESDERITFTTADAARVGSMDQMRVPFVFERRIDEEISLLESNFSMFFALAVQTYMSTLVADDTPLDRYLEGDTNALTAQQISGMKIFEGKGKCLNCHSGAELTNASVTNVMNQRLETMVMGDEFTATYDNGFYNIGVRPTKEDIGLGGSDPFGYPLSETKMTELGLAHLLGNGFDPENEPKPECIKRVAVNGAFKTPGLRNVELTGPYFHSGTKASLMQVVDFYDRGGDFRQQNQDDLDPDIRRLHLTDLEKEDLVAFLLALTDERVRYKKAPFDHPSLCLTDGHQGDENLIYKNGESMRAKDTIRCIPAVGKDGVGRKYKLKPFLEVDHFLGDEFKSINISEY